MDNGHDVIKLIWVLWKHWKYLKAGTSFQQC